ncbi:glutamine amidotransferase [Corynebacterium gerontici]|nr:glutamine amidotransferase [Corynebacterium gerontici]
MVNVLLVSVRTGEDVIQAEYVDVLETTGLQPEHITHQIVDDPEDSIDLSAGSFDGIIVGGSPLNVTNEQYTEWQHTVHRELRALIHQPIPTLFICYGNSFLTYATGGIVRRNFPEEAGPTDVILTEAGMKDPLFQGLPRKFQSLGGHTESAEELDESVTRLAGGPHCPIQAIRANESTWATQFHPELTTERFVTRIGFYLDYGYFNAAEFDQVAQRARAIDTTASNQVMLNFLQICQQYAEQTKSGVPQ